MRLLGSIEEALGSTWKRPRDEAGILHFESRRSRSSPSSEGGTGDSLSDILDAGRRVGVELPAALAQQILDGGKVTFVDGQVARKLGSAAWPSKYDVPESHLGTGGSGSAHLAKFSKWARVACRCVST